MTRLHASILALISMVTQVSFNESNAAQADISESKANLVDEIKQPVVFIETDESNCLVNDGKMISLQLMDITKNYEVWVDRWYMQVQTADHTKQLLTPSQTIAELGCSKTYAGPQHWTIYNVKAVP